MALSREPVNNGRLARGANVKARVASEALACRAKPAGTTRVCYREHARCGVGGLRVLMRFGSIQCVNVA